MARMENAEVRARERLLRLEAEARAQREAREVERGVTETVTLSRSRGAAIAQPFRRKPRQATPYRRQAGLEWLVGKGRLTAAQKAAGELYGATYRRVSAGAAIRSSLDLKPQGGAPGGAPLSQVVARAHSSAEAAARLDALRARLLHQEDLISACDLICGQELTPREAAGGEREAGRLEAVLKVALDILAQRPR